MEYKNSSDIIQNNKNQKIYATIKDIEKINLQIEELKLSINKKEDDLKNIINEKDKIIKELEQKILDQENKIKNNENEIKHLTNQINKLNNTKFNNEFINKKKNTNNNIFSNFHFRRRVEDEFWRLKSFENDYGFLNSIGAKILKPQHGDFSKIELFIKAPDNSPYRNGIFHFLIRYYNDYPKMGPEIRLKTKIFHTEYCDENYNYCRTSFLKKWNPQIWILEIISVLYEFFSYQTFDGYSNEASNLFRKHDMYKFNEKCKEYVNKYALKEFNSEYNYLFQENSFIKKNFSNDSFTLTFVCIENLQVYQFSIDKEEADKPAYYYISHYISPIFGDKVLIVGNKIFHSSISIKACLESEIIFMIPMLKEFSDYQQFIKK